MHPHDRQAVLELRSYDAEACPRGHHEGDIEKYAPTWVLCDLCAAIEAMEKKPPGPGNHLVLLSIEEAERRNALMAADDD